MMKISKVAVFAVGVMICATGCKKKNNNDEGGQPKANEGSGSAAVVEPTKPATPEVPAGQKIADLYKGCIELVNAKKFDEFGTQCLADGYVGHQADLPETQDRAKAIAEFKDLAAAFPDMKLEPQLVLISGQTILSVMLTSGTHTGPFKTPMGELPATNKKFGQLVFHRLAIDADLKAAEEWFFMDPTTLMGQLGLLPKEAPPVRPAMDKGLEGAPIVVIAADDAKEKANLEATTKSEAAFNSHKIEDAMAVWTDDAVESDQAGAQDATGAAEIKAGTEMFIKMFSDVKIETPGKWAVGDYAVTIGTFTGTNDGDMGPMKATGKQVRGEFAEVTKLVDGKVSKLWRFRNGMAMAMQLGLMPAPGAPDGKPDGKPDGAAKGK